MLVSCIERKGSIFLGKERKKFFVDLWRSQKNDYFQLYFAASAQKPPELAKYNILYSANSRNFYENWQNIIKNHLPRKNFLPH